MSNDKENDLNEIKGVHMAMNQLFSEMLSDGISPPGLLAGTSMALIMLAHKMGFDKEDLKKRVCSDMDILYYMESQIKKETMQ